MSQVSKRAIAAIAAIAVILIRQFVPALAELTDADVTLIVSTIAAWILGDSIRTVELRDLLQSNRFRIAAASIIVIVARRFVPQLGFLTDEMLAQFVGFVVAAILGDSWRKIQFVKSPALLQDGSGSKQQ